MILDRPGIDTEFKLLLLNNPGATCWNYSADLMINDKLYSLPTVNYVNIRRQYNNDKCDIIMMGAKLPLRMYEQLLIPNARNFEIMLTRTLVGTDGTERENDEKYFRVYRGFLDVVPDTKMTKDTRGGTVSTDDTLGQLVDINVQLIEDVVYEMDLTATGGVIRDTSFKDILSYFLSHKLKEVEIKKTLLDLRYNRVRGVDVVPPHNTKKPEFVLIPSNTLITDIPHLLQKNHGIYSSGMGYYFQDGWWHVYPLFDTTRFEKVKKSLTLLCVPKEELPTSEKTYLYRDEQLYVFSTGQRMVVDLSDEMGQQLGTVTRWWTSSDLLDSMYKIKDNKATPALDETMRTMTMRRRTDKRNRVVQPDGNFTDNPYLLTSKNMLARGRYLTTSWDSCDQTLLYPGMPSKILYVENDELVEVKGTLLKADIDIKPATEGYTDNTFKSSALLTFFIEDDEKRLD